MLKRTNQRSSTLLLLLTLFFIAGPFGRPVVMAQQKGYKPGDIVEVNWIDSWVPGKIDKCLNASTCMVYFYDAAHARYETNSSAIMMDHIRVAAGQPRPIVATADVKFTVGQRVEYFNDGKWYKP